MMHGKQLMVENGWSTMDGEMYSGRWTMDDGRWMMDGGQWTMNGGGCMV